MKSLNKNAETNTSLDETAFSAYADFNSMLAVTVQLTNASIAAAWTLMAATDIPWSEASLSLLYPAAKLVKKQCQYLPFVLED